MTETVSNVFDVASPNPLTLQEISALVVVEELWRRNIRSYLRNYKPESIFLHRLPSRIATVLEKNLPNLPRRIYDLLSEYVKKVPHSVWSWMKGHSFTLFRVSPNGGWDQIKILRIFDDFALDWNGNIHEVRTAKRMLLCDRISIDRKFRIACLYCFEEDIKRIWPSVCTKIDLNKTEFQYYSECYYWICFLRNELHKIPNSDEEPIDETMLYKCKPTNYSRALYFWNRIPLERLSQAFILKLSDKNPELFARFILPKLNEPQLVEFLAERGEHLIITLLTDITRDHYDERDLVIPIWMHIRNKIDKSTFTTLIQKLLFPETNDFWSIDSFSYSDRSDRLFWISIKGIWNSRRIEFLIEVLQDAAFEERNAFWRINWRKLICNVPVEDLVVMMELSFRNESEITSFKENIMSMCESIAEGCTSLLKYGKFEELNDLLSVCCLDERKRMELKRRLLRSNYVGENSVFTDYVVRNNKLLNEFIDDAFQDAADLGTEFRNQLTSSPVTQNCLLECTLYDRNFVMLMKFVETFFPDEKVVVPLKKRLFEHFKEHLLAGGKSITRMDSDSVQVFLIWLLGSEDEVIRFKQSITVEEVFRTMMQIECRRIEWIFGIGRDTERKSNFPEKVDHFLMWYFNNDEKEIEKLTKPFLNEFKSFARIE